MTLMNRGAFARPGTTLSFKTGTWRVQRPVHRHRTAPCAGACPAGEDAQAYLARLAEGDPRGAWETIVQANPLPAITGRICPHPCESECNRGQYDQPLAIHAAERFLGDEAIARGWAYPAPALRPGAPEVAVVGAGPSGLSAAWQLRRLGYRVTVLDALPEAGGTVRSAIPGYRLPRDVLDAEVERLLACGIEFRPKHRLGADLSLNELSEEYGAVYLAPGLVRGQEWSASGATPEDLHNGIDLLRAWLSFGEAPRPASAAVIGGGNTAVDTARILRRAGVPEVHIITHYALPGANVPQDDVMGAVPREIHQAQEEGVVIHEHRGVSRLMLRGKRVVGIEMVHMRKLTRDDGRRDRVPFPGTETVLKVDHVIPAIGQAIDPAGMSKLLDGGRHLVVGPWGEVAGHPGLYAGGDARGGPGVMASAVGDGRRAALAIDRYLRGMGPPEEPEPRIVPFAEINTHYFERAPRAEGAILPPEQRKGCEEIEGGLSTGQAQSEAQRCFSCGNCMACDNCWTLCPDSAVLKTQDHAADGSSYVFDYDYCKGCGLCANECPCGYIAMVEES